MSLNHRPDPEIITPDGKVYGRKKTLWQHLQVLFIRSGLLGIVIVGTYTFLQLYAGFIGIEHYLGMFWAFVSVFLAFALRITLPLSIGAFFGAMNVWGWHWFFALLFAAPALILFFILLTGGVVGISILKSRR